MKVAIKVSMGFVNGFDHDTSGVDHETPWKFSHQSDLGMLLN